ncbi:hypothetical protein [Borrelia crocidurae]|uniref:Lipoprotein n=1 Tax=Borrelia crocidurae (strain Achema) TaxID=1155096 RepID=I0FE38_BORCA|nr:hypothetical protein [Borrelia crocidurae]AFI31744.1 hypothetical protein Q7M_1036 [Borrelia crocidurae str. Achema]
MKGFYIKFGSLVIFIISCSQATQENLAWKKAFGTQKSTNSTYSLKNKQDKLNKLRKRTRNTTETIKEKPLELEKKTQKAKKQDKKEQEAQQLESEPKSEPKSELESTRKKQEEIRETKLQAEKTQEAQRLKSELESELELARQKQEEIKAAKAQEAEQKIKKQLELEKQIAERGIIAIEEKIEELESKLLKAQEELELADEAYSNAYDKLEEAEETENEEEKIQAQQEEKLAALKYEEMQHEKSTIEKELKDTKKTLKSEQAKLLYAQSGILQEEIKEKETILNEFFQLISQINGDDNPKNSITQSNRHEKFSASYGYGLGIPLVSFSILIEADRRFFNEYFNDQAIAAAFKYNKNRLYPILLGVTRIYDAYQKLKKKGYDTKEDENYKKMKEYANVTTNFLYNIHSLIPSLNSYYDVLDNINRNIHKIKINATIEELSNMKNKIEKWIQKLLETANKIHSRLNSVIFQEFNILPETEEYYKVFKSINDDDNLQQEIKTTNDYFSEYMAYARSIIHRVISQEN